MGFPIRTNIFTAKEAWIILLICAARSRLRTVFCNPHKQGYVEPKDSYQLVVDFARDLDGFVLSFRKLRSICAQEILLFQRSQ
jgi:hypothetical protein